MKMKKRLSVVHLIIFLITLSVGVNLYAEESISASAATAVTETAVTAEKSIVTTSEAVTAAPVVEAEKPKADTGDTAWILISSALVLFMTVPALALFYGGMSRKKNMLSTFYYSLSAAIVVSVMWVAFQYSMTFGGKDVFGIFGNLDKAFMNGITIDSLASLAPNIPESVFAVFQMTFAIITVALISGAIVERLKFSAWIVFVILWSVVVYTPLAHWVWNADGWICKMGALDFAGGLVVHISSGVSALVAALFIGERVRYKKDTMLPNNIPYVFIGATMLWFGWFGFNAGSALGANGLAGNAFLVTNTAAAVAAITWMVIEWFVHGKPSVIGAVSGLVAGLVAITPAAGFVDTKAAFIIGIVVSILCFLFVAKVKKALGYDDSLDAFGVHGIGGTWGAIATGLFANHNINPNGVKTVQDSGLFYSGNFNLLGKQLISVGAAYGIAIVGTLVILLVMKQFMKLRVEPQEEIFGLDLVEHGEKVD